MEVDFQDPKGQVNELKKEIDMLQKGIRYTHTSYFLIKLFIRGFNSSFKKKGFNSYTCKYNKMDFQVYVWRRRWDDESSRTSFA